MKRAHHLAIITLILAMIPAANALESGINQADFDKSVRFQDDLFLAVNGTWLKNTEIPADRSNFGAFSILEDLSQARTREIIEAAANTTSAKGSDAQKVGDLYKSFMDVARIESLGTKPLRTEMDKISALGSYDDLFQHFGYLATLGIQSPVAFYIGQDAKSSAENIAHLRQSGTFLPDRDYYLKDDPKSAEARKAYLAYIQTVLVLVGQTEAEARTAAQAILELETVLARAQRPRVELRNPEKNYNKMTVAKLFEIAPGFGWERYLKGQGAAQVTTVIVGQPEFIKAATETIRATPISVWKNYLTLRLVDTYAVALPAAFEKASFEFHSKALAGVPEDRPRWKKAAALIGGEGAGDFGVLGDIVGRLYVEKYFPPAAKARMEQLVQNLLTVYDRSISDLTWMSAETKIRAREKLAKYTRKIGYPEQWRDYSGLTIDPNDLIGNLLASHRVEHQRMLARLGKPVDRHEWHMTPQTVNAYYNPGFNEIVFPAAILQPPFFNALADDAVNYGGIASVIGHEVSHGFDDQGSQFDGDGNLKNWWTADDAAAFKSLTTKLGAQYNACEALPGKFVNGGLTMGENIADLSGQAIAFKAYQYSLGGKPAPVMDGFTGYQRFFLGWAQIWKRKYRENELAKRLLTDPHSPSQFRANVPSSNSDAFVEAFGLKPGDKLYKTPEERLKIW